MEQAAARGRGKAGAEDWITDHQACALAYSGRLQQAKTMLQRAADLAQQATKPESAALYETGGAVWEAFFGNVAEAKKGATAALDLSKSRDVQYGAAFALALSGDSVRSRALANDLEGRFPEDTSVRYSYLPTLHALFALNDGESSEAIDLLQNAVRYELGTPGSSFNGNFGSLYPVYVRGEAYLTAHHGAEAAAEFQKILDHRGVVLSDPIAALARLQLGRAYALEAGIDVEPVPHAGGAHAALNGSATPEALAKAKATYQDFLTLWKDADSDIPILKQAHAEYAKLK
jgi:hypothetical protein